MHLDELKFSKQRGFSIIEVMVSVLVLVVGFLGMAGLQTTSLQNSNKSLLRTHAAYLSYEILDRIRANGGVEYSTDFDSAATFVDCLSNSCSGENLRNFDLAEWKCSIAGTEAACSDLEGIGSLRSEVGLPNGQGDIKLNGGVYTVQIRWYEEKDGASTADIADDSFDSFTISVSL
ncbi:type IV pilus assembly protein PilV [Alteromonadaceae bacterium Bs31]|nr:type IV pilus assembly protein PilV [Alteromonadaceae bacterium Bs31]